MQKGRETVSFYDLQGGQEEMLSNFVWYWFEVIYHKPVMDRKLETESKS